MRRSHRFPSWMVLCSGIFFLFAVSEANAQAPKKKGQPQATAASPKTSKSDRVPPRTPKAAKTWEKLGAEISMAFPDETPLEDVLKYVKEASKGKDGKGLSIYIDPKGLADANATLSSLVKMDLEDAPLSTTLGLMLKQIDLGFYVRDDGVLVVTDDVSAALESEPILEGLESQGTIQARLDAIEKRLSALEAGTSKGAKSKP